jgi:ATPase subunit of ABC transporter with duplicated ATPase domains
MSFNLPNGKALFAKLNLAFARQKIGLVGNNGVGKSTLIKLITGELHPSSGSIQIDGTVAHLQQNPLFGPELTVAKVLGHEDKLNALQRIEEGGTDPNDFLTIDDDWLIKEKLKNELAMFDLDTLHHFSHLSTLSGGEFTKLMLTNAFLSNADFLLLDEPTNHLDSNACKKLYDAILKWQRGLIVVSHDRTLLNLMGGIVEITSLGISSFGGNYDFYKEQKEYLIHAKQNQYSDAKSFLEKTKRSIQLTKEKHEQRQVKGRDLRKRGDQPKMLLDAMENRSTSNQSSLSTLAVRMLNSAHEKLHLAKEQLEIQDEIHVSLPKTYVPNGKVILEIEHLNFRYHQTIVPLINDFSLTIQGAKRIALCGENGSGKTTLIKLILNQLKPSHGKIFLGTERINYLDQHASQLKPELSILDNFLQLNVDATENEAYQALAQFLFKNSSALKLVKHLSGGEKLRALLACILKSSHPPQLLILDEPTNHLDLNSMKNIECALKNYQGAMIVISHDQTFLESIAIEKMIYAPFKNE